MFKVSWPEPRGETEPTHAGGSSGSPNTLINTGMAATIHVKTRVFIVVRPKTHHCLCLPVYTYSHQATSKTGIKPEDHAPLIQENTEVEYHPEEQQGRLRVPITLILEDPTLHWSPLSRINLAKVQSVEYNIKVRTVGRVEPASLSNLEELFREAIGLNED